MPTPPTHTLWRPPGLLAHCLHAEGTPARAGLPGSGRWQHSPLPRPGRQGRGVPVGGGARGRRRPDQAQATRHSCGHTVLLSEVAFSLRLEKSKTGEPCVGIIALPRPLWPLLGVGGCCAPPAPGEEARQAAAWPRSPPRPASCPSGTISVCGHPGHVGAGRAVTEELRGGELITRRPPGPEPASLQRAPDAACCSSAIRPQLPMVGSRSKSFPTAAPA